MARDTTAPQPAPKPCNKRPINSHSKEALGNKHKPTPSKASANPAINTGRRPRASLNGPYKSCTGPKAKKYTETNHCTRLGSSINAKLIAGNTGNNKPTLNCPTLTSKQESNKTLVWEADIKQPW